jgi:hypothetical protein
MLIIQASTQESHPALPLLRIPSDAFSQSLILNTWVIETALNSPAMLRLPTASWPEWAG